MSSQNLIDRHSLTPRRRSGPTPADGPYNMTYTIGSWNQISWPQELQVEYDSEMGNRRDTGLNTGSTYGDSVPGT